MVKKIFILDFRSMKQSHISMPPKTKKTSNLEAVRKHRAKVKADAQAHQEYLESERKLYQRRKEAGKLLQVKNLSPRDQRSIRKKWRKAKRKQRSRQTIEKAFITPPESPEGSINHSQGDPQPSTSNMSIQKQVGRKKMRREQRKAYRTIQKLTDTNKKYQNRIRLLTRRFNRLQNTMNISNVNTPISTVDQSSPASKARKLAYSGNKDKIR